MSTEKLKRSRQRLLDLTLRNRLLNFRPGDPAYTDDLRTHKHIVLKGKSEAVWAELVAAQKPIEIVALTPEEQARVDRELRYRREQQRSGRSSTDVVLAGTKNEEWDDIRTTLRRLEQQYLKGSLISLLPEQLFHKRIAKIRNEQNTLSNSTGDSAMFLAIGFLQWAEREPHPRAGEKMFAPLILLHVNLEQRKRADGGHRDFLLRMDADQAQGNPCLAEKLRQDFGFDFPDLLEDETATQYLSRLTKLLKSKKEWAVNSSIALGFFNFARYRLWLDLDPKIWPPGASPTDHAIVSAILNGDPIAQPAGIPDEAEVALHQEQRDLPTVLDADSTQYAALLACERGASTIIAGPPGSGKSQTIANLIATAMNAGKKVLFVAQKLPALQVVHRRLQRVGLDAFCLPLFSDKARVAELHSHLAGSQHIHDSSRRPRPYSNVVMNVASKLNAFASRLREPPEGFVDGAGNLIQRGTALHLELRDRWKEQWTDDLLAVSMEQPHVSPEWLDEREQTLHQWHSLYAEVGNIWSDWCALRVGAMDISTIEKAVANLASTAEDLKGDLQLLPTQYHDCALKDVDDLHRDLRKIQFDTLINVIPSLLDFLWVCPDNANTIARIERDVIEFKRQLTSAAEYLRITEENRRQASVAIAKAVRTITDVVNCKYSLPEVKSVIASLNETVRSAEELAWLAATQPDGIAAVWTSSKSESESTVKWIHLDRLPQQEHSWDLSMPHDCVPALAAHVRDNREKEQEAEALADCLDRYESCVGRLFELRVPEFMQIDVGAFDAIEQSVRTLLEYSLDHLTLRDFSKTIGLLRQVLDSGANCVTPDFSALCRRVFSTTTVTTTDINRITQLAALPAELLRPINHDSGDFLRRLVRQPDAITILDQMTGSITAYRSSVDSLRRSFRPPLDNIQQKYLDEHLESSTTIEELGLRDLTLSSVLELKNTISKIRELIAAALVIGRDVEGWPCIVPETVKDIRDLRNLLIHLVNRPPAPADLSWAMLCQQDATNTLAAARKQASDLNHFRGQHSAQIAFTDVPDIDRLKKNRRELRRLASSWIRWFSPEYYAIRRDIRSYLKPPFSSDKRTVLLLDELEVHESQRIAFEESGMSSMLGEVFQGIETDWAFVDLIVSWIEEVKVLTHCADVTPFVRFSITQSEELRDALSTVEVVLRGLQMQSEKLLATGLFPRILDNLDNGSCQQLVAGLGEIEKRLGTFLERVENDLTCRFDHKCSSVSDAVRRLQETYHAQELLTKYDALTAPQRAVEFPLSTIGKCRQWLTDINESGLNGELIIAAAEGALDVDDIRFALLAATFRRDLMGLSVELGSFNEWADEETPITTILDETTDVP